MHVRAGKLAPPTLARYETSIARLTLAFCGEPDELGDTAPTPLSLTTEKTLVDFVEARHKEERSSSTIRNDVAACSQVLAYAVGKGWISSNLARILDRRFWIGSADAEMERIDPPNDKQVAALIAEGLTNQAIASRLRVAPRTAEAHVENIRRKLDVRSRAQIAAWTTDQRWREHRSR